MRCFALFILVLLAVPALAETARLGPYQVSFDSGQNIELAPGNVSSATTYSGVNYTMYTLRGNADSTLKIMLTRFDKQINTSATGLEMLARGQMKKEWGPVTVDRREVDGHPAVLGTGKDEANNVNVYACGWYADNQTALNVFSTYPWDKGTLQILRTIHVTELRK